MALIVQKYGGTSLGSVELIKRAAQRVVDTRDQGNQIVVVLSAMGDATDRLMDLARETTDEPACRELDMLLSSGEQVSVALMCMALKELDCDARSYTGAQVKVMTDSNHAKARILDVETDRLQNDIATGCVPVVTGFQGIDEDGQVTTIGRGGSDTSAVAIAAALSADECQILTDVDGVFSTDPRMVPDARLLDRITFEEMIELSGQGTRVLQTRAVELAGKYNVPLRVLPSFHTGSGTLISFEETDLESPVVSGIAFNRDEAEVTVTHVPDKPGVAHRILEPLAEAGIEIDMIVLNAPRSGRVDFSFTVPRADFKQACDLAKAAIAGFEGSELLCSDRVAKISVVGLGMRGNAGVAATVFEALASSKINVRMVSTSEIKITVLVDETDLEKAVNCLHKSFNLDRSTASDGVSEPREGTAG